MTTYTVLNCNGEFLYGGCTAADAAHAVMTYNGHEYEIRRAEDGNGWELWTTKFSRNSTCYRGLSKSTLYSVESDEAKASAEIYAKVIRHAIGDSNWWEGLDVVNDADYAAFIASLEEEIA